MESAVSAWYYAEIIRGKEGSNIKSITEGSHKD